MLNMDLKSATMTKKRKSEHYDASVPPAKKQIRGDAGWQASMAEKNFDRGPQNGSSRGLPPLPPISAALSKRVFTHQSILSAKDNRNQFASYERLEFLGDAYIELMATRLIWDKFTNLPQGRLSQIRELLVKNETLGEIAVRYGLEKRIKAAAHVRANQRHWSKVKGDLVEAYVAAIILADAEVGGAGFAAAEAWLYPFWISKLEGLAEEKVADLNAKDALSRKVVSSGVKVEYLEERAMEQLKGGQQTYFIGAFLTGWGYQRQLLGSGKGLNKTVAGNLAAEDALQNPLVESVAELKREHDEMAKVRRERLEMG